MIKLITLFSFTMLAISQETAPSIVLRAEEKITEPFSYKKKFLYGSLSLIPGGGVSDRERTGSKGTAYDYKIGALPFVFDTVTWIPVVSFDYNFLHYTRELEASPYFSYGVGVAMLVPYIPLRAGFEFKNGFLDVGAKMVLGVFPSPEIRGGYRINF